MEEVDAGEGEEDVEVLAVIAAVVVEEEAVLEAAEVDVEDSEVAVEAVGDSVETVEEVEDLIETVEVEEEEDGSLRCLCKFYINKKN